MVHKLTGLWLLAALICACAAPAATGPAIQIEAAWARPAAVAEMDGMAMGTAMPGMGGGATSAVYLTIRNDGGQADRLTGVNCIAAEHASVHETRVEQGVAKMMPVDSLEIPARGKVEFKPGGYHVMLEGLKQDLKVGDSVQVILQFEKSGAVTVNAAVRQP